MMDAPVSAAFNPDLHPRGRDGKFIRTFGWVKWFDAVTGDHGRGQVYDIKPSKDGGSPDIYVRRDDGTTIVKHPDELSQAPAPKGVLQVDNPAGESTASRPLTQSEVWDAKPGDDLMLDGAPVKLKSRFFEVSGTGAYRSTVVTALGHELPVDARDVEMPTQLKPIAALDPSRLGQCYVLSGKYVSNHVSEHPVLVHGSIQGFGNPRIDHAWVETQNGTVWEPVTNQEWDPRVFEAFFHPEEHDVYSSVEALTQMVDTGHYGPWHDEPVDRVADMDAEGSVKNVTPSSSLDVYLDKKSHFVPERQALHNDIVNEMLDGHDPQDQPVMTFVAGGPAAGKSSLLDSGLLDMPEDSVLVNPDLVKEKLPEYQQMMADGNPDAAAFVHEESSLVARTGRIIAEDEHMNITLDGTGDSSISKIRSKVDKARADGYRIDAHYVTADIDVALQRNEARYQKTGRYVPEKFIRDTHRKVSRVVLGAIDQKIFDNLDIWDTTDGDTPVKIAELVDGELVVYDDGAWNLFVAKAELPPAPSAPPVPAAEAPA